MLDPVRKTIQVPLKNGEATGAVDSARRFLVVGPNGEQLTFPTLWGVHMWAIQALQSKYQAMNRVKLDESSIKEVLDQLPQPAPAVDEVAVEQV